MSTLDQLLEIGFQLRVDIHIQALLSSSNGGEDATIKVVTKKLSSFADGFIEMSEAFSIGVNIPIVFHDMVVNRLVDEMVDMRGTHEAVMILGGVDMDMGILRDLDGSLDFDSDSLLILLFGQAGVDPWDDAVASRVSDPDILVSFKSLPGPQGTLPTRKVHDFLIGDA